MIATIAGIPVYEALVTDDDTGMIRISLVDDPAVQSNFLAFSEDKRPLAFAVQDEDRRLVRGVIMRADYPIFRVSNGMEYYVIYKAETIRKMAEKYLLDNRQNAVDIMHDGAEVPGVQMVQYFIKDTAAGVNPAGFEDIADGSLFAEFHVLDDGIWAEIKAGTYRGFSLEGIFEMHPTTEQAQPVVDKIVSDLDGQFMNIPNYNKMTKIERIKALLAKALVECANVTTDKGVLEWDHEGDLVAGDAVYIVNEDGVREAAADGDYITEDGKTIRVAEGKVVEILDPEAEIAPAEPEAEPEAEAPAEFASKDTDKGAIFWEGEEDLKEGDAVFVENEGERVPAEDGEYKTEDGKTIVVVEGKVAEIRDPEAEVAPEETPAAEEELRKENETLRAEVESLRAEVAELKAAPLAKSAHEEMQEAGAEIKTGVKGLDKIARLMRAK